MKKNILNSSVSVGAILKTISKRLKVDIKIRCTLKAFSFLSSTFLHFYVNNILSVPIFTFLSIRV